MLNYNHFYYFYVTSKYGGISAAAKFLNISQPSLSSQIKIFESSLNQKLFEKKGRSLQLTPEGERAYIYAKRVFEITADFSASIQTRSNLFTQRVRIGITDQVERPFIADLLSPLIKAQSSKNDRSFYINSSPNDSLLAQLKSSEIDLVLTNKPIYEENIKELASANMPVNLIVATRNLRESQIRVGRQTSALDFLDATNWGLIIPSYKLKLRHETDLFFQENKTRKKVVLESDILSVVGRAIVDGAGVGFIPVPYVHEEVKNGLLTVIGPKAGYWKHSIYLVGRKDAIHDPALNDIIQRVKKMNKLF